MASFTEIPFDFNTKQLFEYLRIKTGTDRAKAFENLVNKIIAKKEAGEDTTAEEQKIDIIVYKLYYLTFNEVRIVEPEYALTEEEYMNYE